MLALSMGKGQPMMVEFRSRHHTCYPIEVQHIMALSSAPEDDDITISLLWRIVTVALVGIVRSFLCFRLILHQMHEPSVIHILQLRYSCVYCEDVVNSI